jgi:hypothetical protein
MPRPVIKTFLMPEVHCCSLKSGLVMTRSDRRDSRPSPIMLNNTEAYLTVFALVNKGNEVLLDLVGA